jgi:succinate dehydrogenase flavin-adding protein (antitoxin of CptAB toxin-antitoxin module)
MLKKFLAHKRVMLTPEQVAHYEKLLEVPENISARLTSYTTNPAPIAARRQEVAKAIEALTNEPNR